MTTVHTTISVLCKSSYMFWSDVATFKLTIRTVYGFEISELHVFIVILKNRT